MFSVDAGMRDDDGSPLGGGFLVGRSAELEALVDLVRDPANRLVTVTGPGGVGKTELVLALARHQVARGAVVGGGPPRPVVARLDGVTDLEGVLLAVASAVALPAGGAGSVAQRLGEASMTGPGLVALDGCEQLGGEPHPLTVLLETCPGYRFVATSLHPSRVAGERVLGLDALQVPPASLEHRDLARFPAVELYCRRAHQADPLFVPTEQDLAAVAELCRRVHGLPLGIELLAARFGFLPARTVAHHLDLLTEAESVGGDEGTPARHRSMTAALRWSYDLLDEETSRMLRLLSLFAGPAPMEMIDSVLDRLRVGGVRPGERTTFDLVSELVDRRLAEADLSTGDPAYRLVPLVRSFARARLEETDGLPVAEEAYRLAVVDFGTARGAPVERAAEDLSLQELERSELDLRLTLGHLVAHEEDHAALRLACSLAPFALRRGFDGFVAPALDVLVGRSGGRDDLLEAQDDELVTEAMLRLAHLRLATEAPEAAGAAQRVLASGVQRARESGREGLLLLGHAIMMQTVPVTGDLAGAAAAAAEALPLAESVGDPVWIARFSAWVGMVHNQYGQDDEACRLGERSLDQALVSEDPRSLIVAMLLVLGLPQDRAAPLLERAPSIDDLLKMIRRCNEPRYEALLLQVGAGHALASGDLRLAASRVVDGLALMRVTPPWVAQVTFGGVMVAVAVGRGDFERAAGLIGLVEPYREQLEALSPPAWAGVYASAVAATRRALGEEVFSLSVQDAAGTGSLGDVLDYAMTVARADDAPDPVAGWTIPGQRYSQELTVRELHVLTELATGATNKQISARMGLAPKTVMHHSTAIYRKLQVRGRAEATAWAFRQGLVS